ncbi:TLR adapter interacting with SLC15A4 on the lysosome [Xenopus laevis]|uniref:Uncharacterized protein n=2 Tax=Xenopus laevis TaxID=8355 RepID=A0A974HYV9_XENLA|nr:TLR adapter interacting with SLC15A4 on the lysosome [Xenopus laevis]OCT95225.1 hypothetical protein XELAEV_18012910mg [Xenopus laevis]
MLSEGYLYGIQQWYEDDRTVFSHYRTTDASNELSVMCSLIYTSTCETRRRRFFSKLAFSGRRDPTVQSSRTSQNTEQASELERGIDNRMSERETSPSLAITDYSNSSKDAYLVPSSCKDICIDYNDLHIAGDQVMAMNSELSDLTCTRSFDFCECPFLESSQIPPTMESINTASVMAKKPSKGDFSCWKAGSIKDKSIMQHQQPLSNSVLNEYLERKVIELYKQYIMDMSCSTTATDIMASELVMNNVQQISMQISREQNMETNKAKDMVISFLIRIASEMQSNVVSTSNLQISFDKA